MDERINIKDLAPEYKALYRTISENEPVTKAELLERLDYSRTTLNRFLAPLLAGGFVIEDGLDESSGGRKSCLYRINPKRYYVVGVLVSRYATRFAVYDLLFAEPLYKTSIFMDDITPRLLCDRIGEIFDDALATLRLSRRDFICAGATIAYRYDRSTGKTSGVDGRDAQWDGVALKSMLEKSMGLPLWTDDVVSASLRHRFLDSQSPDGKGYRNIGVFGSGIITHAGVIFDGKIIRGISDGFAHMTIDENGEFCTCGKRGCLSAYTYSDRLVGNYRLISHSRGNISINELCRLCCEGDHAAEIVIKDAARHLATGIINLIRLFSLELVSVNGLLVYECPVFFETCRDIILSETGLTVREVIMNKDGQFVSSEVAAKLAFRAYLS